MKVVLDTNVLISGIIFSGTPSRILTAWADGRFELLASVEILTEYHRVADRLHAQFPTVDIKAVLDFVTRETRIVEPSPVPRTACDDQDDLKFLACALAGQADCIVTDDRALLRSSGFQRIEVLTPREFARRHLGR